MSVNIALAVFNMLPIEPLDGFDKIKDRRKIKGKKYNLSNGPGKLSLALGINKKFNGESFKGKTKILAVKVKVKIK